jgi:hypothetical protein
MLTWVLAEITRQRIAERRTALLNIMSIDSSIRPDDLAGFIRPFLESDPYDIPMAMVYKLDEDMVDGKTMAVLRGCIGVPAGHPLAIKEADMRSSAGLIPFFRKAYKDVVTCPVGKMFDGIKWGGFQEPSKYFSVIPIREASCLYGFLVLGANPRRPIDEDYHQFMRDVSIKVGSISASVVSNYEMRKHKERLENQLESSERQIRFFAEHATVGMQNLGVDGVTVVRMTSLL